MHPAAFQAKYGNGEFWKRLARAGNFYGDLPEMADAQQLFEAVKHLKPDHPHRPAAGQMGGAAKGTLGGRAFPRRADHHHHGAREASAHG